MASVLTFFGSLQLVCNPTVHGSFRRAAVLAVGQSAGKYGSGHDDGPVLGLFEDVAINLQRHHRARMPQAQRNRIDRHPGLQQKGGMSVAQLMKAQARKAKFGRSIDKLLRYSPRLPGQRWLVGKAWEHQSVCG